MIRDLFSLLPPGAINTLQIKPPCHPTSKVVIVDDRAGTDKASASPLHVAATQIKASTNLLTEDISPQLIQIIIHQYLPVERWQQN